MVAKNRYKLKHCNMRDRRTDARDEEEAMGGEGREGGG
jgi:hypothetical protein